MKVLVVGSGGREHALCWAISASPLLTKLYCAPGNPGIAAVAECVDIGVLDIPTLVGFAQDNAIDLVVPGPEAPLVAGITDAMEAVGIACCGPTRAAAQLEGSKTFAKEICDAAGIPTALWERFDDLEAARAFVHRRGAPIVVKADGLAAGKGVVVAGTEQEALAAIDAMMERKGLRRRRRSGRYRGMSCRPGGLPVRALRRRGRPAARFRPGLQARRRRRYRAEYRWHGRLLAGSRVSAGPGGSLPGTDHPPGAEGNGAPGHAVPRCHVRRSDADRRRREADRIQRPVRRSGMPGSAHAG